MLVSFSVACKRNNVIIQDLLYLFCFVSCVMSRLSACLQDVGVSYREGDMVKH